MRFYNKYFEKQKIKVEAKEKELRIHWWAIGIIVAGILGYFLNFALRPFVTCKISGGTKCEWQWISSATGTWGEFGDFVGGTINPFIGLVTVVLLVHSIRLTISALKQNEEALNISKDELIETRRAVEHATAAQEKMEASLRAQLVEAKSQNNFANYYVHLDEFKKHVYSISKNYFLIDAGVNLKQLHSLLFPDLKTKGSDNISKVAISELLKVIYWFLFHLAVPESYGETSYNQRLLDVKTFMLRLRSGLVNGGKDSFFVYDDEFKRFLDAVTIYSFSDLIENVAFEIDFCAEILEFECERSIIEDLIFVADNLKKAAKLAPKYDYVEETKQYKMSGGLDMIPFVMLAKIAVEHRI